MTSTKPVIILVTGAWHLPEHYAKVSNRLRHCGYVVECPRLQTNNNATSPTKTIADDIQQIRNITLRHLDEGNNVVALMHSYGGMVGTHAFAGLSSQDRPGQPYVQALIYMAAFVPLETESLAGIFGGKLPPWIERQDSGILTVKNPEHHFYNDVDGEAAAEAASKLVVHPANAQFEAPPDSGRVLAWRNIPVTYIMCQKEEALVLEAQDMMVQRLEKQVPRIAVRREICDSGHSPFLSQPKRVVDVVVAVAG